MTLGEMLIQAGLVTTKQFEEALKNRVIYGGKIGTSLVELGFIDEDVLAKALSEQLSLPYVDPSLLMTIPADVIELIPRELAAKYKVIPLGLERKKLSLIMADPTDLMAIDALAFATGYQIEPVLTPEVRLMQALKHYYDITIDPRYIPVIKKLAERADSLTPPPVSKPVKGTPPLAKIASPPVQPVPKVPAAAAALQGEGVPKGGAAKDEGDLELLSDKIAASEDREEIASLMMEYVAANFHRGALFMIRENSATGWRAMMMKMALAGFEHFQLTFDEPSVLKVVAETGSYYLGPIPDTAANQRMLKAMGGGTPNTILLLPLVLQGRVVNVLYVEGKGKELRDGVAELQKLINKAAMAFEILILKNKIKIL